MFLNVCFRRHADLVIGQVTDHEIKRDPTIKCPFVNFQLAVSPWKKIQSLNRTIILQGYFTAGAFPNGGIRRI